MNKKVNLKITNHQDIIDGLNDKIEYEDQGLLKKKRDNYYLIYNDFSEGIDGARTTVKIEPEQRRVFLLRSEPVKLKQTFIKGEKENGIYKANGGEFKIEVETQKLDLKINKDYGRVDIHYKLYFADRLTSRNRLEIQYNVEGG